MTPSLLKCNFDGSSLTVGEKKVLTCDLGHNLPSNGHWEFSNLIDTTADKNQAFEIQFLGSPVVQGSTLNQTFTSYKVGGHTFNQIKLKTDEGEFQVSPLSIEVKSVISGSPTPFPNVDPLGIAIPLWWWCMWGGLLFILLIAGLWQLLKYRKRKKAKIATESVTKLTPREDFQAKIRKLESKGYHNRGEYKAFALELTTIVKKTIGNELAFAAEDLTSEELLETVERRHKAYFTTAGRTLENFLNDLDQIKFAKVETTAQACTDLLDRGARIGNALFGRSS